MSLTSSPLSSLTSCLTSSNPPVYCILSFPLTETCPCRGSWTQCWSWFNLWATSPLLVFSLKAAAPSSWASSWTFMRRYISSLTLVLFFPPRPSFSWNVLVISYFHLSFICKQVCDTYLKFGLPLIVMPPPGVFYQALFSIDPVSVDHLAFIMFRSELRVASIV